MTSYLFVYGTLMSCFENPMARMLRRKCTFYRNGVLNGELYDIGSYPGLILRGTETVKGEIFELHHEGILKELDKYEGIGTEETETDEYERVMVEVFINDKSLICWAYVYKWPIEGFKRIENGDYKKYILQD